MVYKLDKMQKTPIFIGMNSKVAAIATASTLYTAYSPLHIAVCHRHLWLA